MEFGIKAEERRKLRLDAIKKRRSGPLGGTGIVTTTTSREDDAAFALKKLKTMSTAISGGVSLPVEPIAVLSGTGAAVGLDLGISPDATAPMPSKSSRRIKQPKKKVDTQIRYDPPPDSNMTEEELKEWRKEQRRIRNRDSAAASRARTKDRIVELETQNEQLEDALEDLRAKHVKVCSAYELRIQQLEAQIASQHVGGPKDRAVHNAGWMALPNFNVVTSSSEGEDAAEEVKPNLNKTHEEEAKQSRKRPSEDVPCEDITRSKVAPGMTFGYAGNMASAQTIRPSSDSSSCIHSRHSQNTQPMVNEQRINEMISRPAVKITGVAHKSLACEILKSVEHESKKSDCDEVPVRFRDTSSCAASHNEASVPALVSPAQSGVSGVCARDKYNWHCDMPGKESDFLACVDDDNSLSPLPPPKIVPLGGVVRTTSLTPRVSISFDDYVTAGGGSLAIATCGDDMSSLSTSTASDGSSAECDNRKSVVEQSATEYTSVSPGISVMKRGLSVANDEGDAVLLDPTGAVVEMDPTLYDVLCEL